MEANIKDAKTRMGQALKKFAGELARVRTGRASLSIFDGVNVDYYGTPSPISQVAGLANPEPNLITIQPWEASLIGEIEKSILAANLGLTPSNDGTIIRIMVPQLTEERRKEYVKQAHTLAENAKTAIRNVRRDVNDAIKRLEKSKEVSKDQMHDGLAQVQKVTDADILKIDQLVKEKEDDIMSF